MNILITLCARGGSKGLPGKNVKLLNGIPLIAYSIKAAQAYSKVHSSDIALSTDSSEIKLIANNFGVNTEYDRPSFLAGDNAGKVETIADLLKFEEERRNKRYDFILDLDVSSPLRVQDDLISSFNLFRNDEKANNLFSVSPSYKNPYFNMVEVGVDGYCNLAKQMNNDFNTRQSAPKVYDMNASFYFYRRKFFDSGFKSVFTNKTLAFELNHICFDIDHALDFEIMEFLVVNSKLGFSL